MKEKARSLKKDLFVVDTGDTHDGEYNPHLFIYYKVDVIMKLTISVPFILLGNGLSDVTSPHGRISQPILSHIPYDLLTVGNVLILFGLFFMAIN